MCEIWIGGIFTKIFQSKSVITGIFAKEIIFDWIIKGIFTAEMSRRGSQRDYEIYPTNISLNGSS